MFKDININSDEEDRNYFEEKPPKDSETLNLNQNLIQKIEFQQIKYRRSLTMPRKDRYQQLNKAIQDSFTIYQLQVKGKQ
ncbi:unnamed protein product [Paramecium sonneborni]|uniref:Uncharacterized protein n=1 Tax=Paramecium sonneborni TaxID=65129 RepID=A0A8S1R593_9CILI|nr:unnamed protein product [Paramecium sonneborni]